MSFYLTSILTIGAIIAIILIYMRSDKNEEFLIFKLIGYYLLGSFRFNLNAFAIPLGFLVYLAAFHPTTNVKFKRNAAVIGLIMFVAGIAAPKYNDYLFTRPIETTALSINLFDNTLGRDWVTIKEKLKVDEVRVDNFQVDFERDGDIRSLRYRLVGNKDGGLVYYDIDLVPSKRAYIIRPAKIDQWMQYPQLISADQFFNLIKDLKARQILPQTEYAWYSAQLQGSINRYDSKNSSNYMLLTKQGVKSIGEDDLPRQGLFLTVFGMVDTSNTNSSSSEAKYYVLSL